MPLLLLAACAAPAAPRAARIEPASRAPYAFDVADPAASSIVVRIDAAPSDAALEAVRVLVAPDSWSRGALFVEGKQLVVRNTPGACERVKELLAALSAQEKDMVAVTARFLKLSREQLSDLRNLEPTNGSLAGLFDREALADVVAGWMKEGAQIISAPRCTAFHGQNAHITIASQTAYIQGHERQVCTGGATDLDPVIGILNEGLSLKVVAVRADNRLQLAASIELSALLPVKVIDVRFEGRVVQLPAATRVSAEQRVSMAGGQSLLLVVRNPDSRDPAHPLVAVVIDASELFD